MLLFGLIWVASALFSPLFVQAQPHAYGGLLQEDGDTFTISSVGVAGVSDSTLQAFLVQLSGLRPGQKVVLPNDPVFAVAIRSIYRLEQYAQVEIRQENEGEEAIKVVINVVPFPILNKVQVRGLEKREEKQLQKQLRLASGTAVKPAEIDNARRTIDAFLKEKGYHLAKVAVQETPSFPVSNGITDVTRAGINLTFYITPGPVFSVKKVSIEGNTLVSDRALKQKMATKERAWWRFWDRSRYDEHLLQEDLDQMLAFMHKEGFYDAHIVQDLVQLDTSKVNPGLHVVITLNEGRPYYIRSMTWEGNTLFQDARLSEWLDIKPGDLYNLTKLQENLYGNAKGSDISSQYMNLGYMRFMVTPRINLAGADSLDLVFEIQEGGVYAFGEIEVAGNYTTNDHVVRRELYSIPGERYSRAAVQESIRRLMQSGYFSERSITSGPALSVDEEEKRVNLRYKVEESNIPRPQLTGSVGQFGLVMGVQLGYNNFSLKEAFKKTGWRPLPSGDGQQIGLNVQANGRAYQQYGFNFTEPWFRGKPAPVGLTTSYTHIGADAVSSDLSGSFNTYAASVFHDRRLKWPSPFFDAGVAIEYRSFNNTIYEELPEGQSRQLELTQSISRNTTDHPVFPTRGSYNRLSLNVGLPVADFVQYHKWRFQSSWNMPLVKNRRLSVNISADLGYIGALNGKEVAFERFVLGGSPLDSQGITTTPILGTDVVYFRGYPLGAFGADGESGVAGRRILTKYTSEFRWMALKHPRIQMMPYAFFDAANTWNSFDTFKVTSLYKSAGFGIRMTLPMVGMVDVVYGRNLDAFTPPDGSSKTGLPGWGLQFSMGRSFNF